MCTMCLCGSNFISNFVIDLNRIAESKIVPMPKIALITGASSGFGKACAEKFASEGYDLIINGRREERLHELKKELESHYNMAVCVLPFDVRNREEVFSSI